jgi:hypothetical protein
LRIFNEGNRPATAETAAVREFLESAFDAYITAFYSGDRISWHDYAYLPTFAYIMKYAKSIEAKAVISNIPSIIDMPYANIVSIVCGGDIEPPSAE